MSFQETLAELAGLNSVFEKSRIHYRRFAGEPEQQEDGAWFVSVYQKHNGDQVTAQGETYEAMAKNLREGVNDYYAWREDESFKSMRST